MIPVDAQQLLACGFDGAAYLAFSPDVAAAGLHPADHYLRLGQHEGRALPIANALGGFEAALRATTLLDPLRLVHAAASHLALHTLSMRPAHDLLLRHIEGSPSYRPLLAIGDSHVNVFAGNHASLSAGFLPLPLIMPGASARGLGNPSSTSGAGQVIARFLHEAVPRLHAAGGAILFQFGQVDVEFVFDLRRAESGRTAWIEAEALAFMDTSIQRYVAYVSTVRDKLPAGLNPHLVAIFPPAISDDALNSVYLNQDITERHTHLAFEAVAQRVAKLEFPDLPTRTRLHAEFNRRLALAATTAGLSVLDGFASLLAGGTLDPALTAHSGGRDHHIDRHIPQAERYVAALLSALPAPATNRSSQWIV